MNMLLPVRATMILGTQIKNPAGVTGFGCLTEIGGSFPVDNIFIEHKHGDDNDVVHCRPSDVAGISSRVPAVIRTNGRYKPNHWFVASGTLNGASAISYRCCGDYAWVLETSEKGDQRQDYTVTFSITVYRSGFANHRYSLFLVQLPYLVHGTSKPKWPGSLGPDSFGLTPLSGPTDSVAWGFPTAWRRKWAYTLKEAFLPILWGYSYKDSTGRWYPLMEPLTRVIDPIVRKLVLDWKRIDPRSGRTHGYGYDYFMSSSSDIVTGYDVPTFADTPFLFAEKETVGDRMDPMLLGLQTNFYWKNWLVQHAYLDALQSMPRLNDNSISNIIELAGFIKSLVIDHRIKIPDTLAEQWLAYRYTYQTSKLDADEAIKFVHRHMDLGTLDKPLTCYGQASRIIDGTDVLCRCRIVVSPRELSTLATIWRSLYTYGLQPSFYVIWDLIPYSFMVDWLIPVGDMASVLDAERMYSGNYYDITHLCYSLSYSRTMGNYSYRCYTRWKSEAPAELEAMYWFDKDHKASDKVKGFRILDVASIFLG